MSELEECGELLVNALGRGGRILLAVTGVPEPVAMVGLSVPGLEDCVLEDVSREAAITFLVGVLAHIGNGRVSDLCGALAADTAFAKDSLAEALAQRGAPFARFATLHDVIPRLATVLAR